MSPISEMISPEALAHGSGGIDAALAHLGGAGDRAADDDASATGLVFGVTITGEATLAA